MARSEQTMNRDCPLCCKPQFWNPTLQEWDHSTGSDAFDCTRIASPVYQILKKFDDYLHSKQDGAELHHELHEAIHHFMTHPDYLGRRATDLESAIRLAMTDLGTSSFAYHTLHSALERP